MRKFDGGQFENFIPNDGTYSVQLAVLFISFVNGEVRKAGIYEVSNLQFVSSFLLLLL